MAKKETSMYTIAMLVVTFIWGFGFIVTTKALDAGYSPSFILMVRFVLSAIVFGVLGKQDIIDATRGEITGGILCGIALFLGFALQTYALPLTTPANNAFLTASNIVLVPFFVWLFFKQRPPSIFFVSAFFCFLGIVILSVDFKNLSALSIGDVLTFLCAISFACHTSLVAYFLTRCRGKVLNFIQMSVAAFLSTILFFVEGADKSATILQPQFLWVGYLAIFSTIIAYLVQTSALKHMHASRVSIISSFESVVAAVISLLLGYDTISTALIVGGLLVFVSISLVEVFPYIKIKKSYKQSTI